MTAKSSNKETDIQGFAAKQWLHRLMDPLLLFPALAILILALIWGATFNVVIVARSAAEHTVTLLGQELADTYEAQVLRALREIDQALKVVKYAQEIRSAENVLEKLRERELLPPELLFEVSITDAEGNIIASTHASDTGNVANQEFFQVQTKEDFLAVSHPLASQDVNDWSLQFSRRLNTADGRFAGIVMISVDAAYFVSGYEAEKMGEHGVLALLGSDGIFRIGRSGETLFAGTTVDYDLVIPPLDEPDRGVKLTTNPWDGVQRYTSTRELYNTPLAIVVGLSAKEQLAETSSIIRTYIWRALAISVLLLLIITVLAWLSRQLALSRQRVVDEHLAHTKRVEHLAYHDMLTELPNRSLFTRLLNQSLNHAHRYDRKLAVLFLDLDGFKLINDSLGHEAGDLLLQEVARRLTDSLRDSDTVARLGGDEFVALLPELQDEKYVAAIAQKVLDAIARPFVLMGQECHVTSSIGISIYPEDGINERILTKHADAAMYHAKETGKNNYQFYSAERNVELSERSTLESDLRQALERNQLELHYQLKMNVNTRKITGIEALLRWHHPELGEIPPAVFLPIAEETGIIISIGNWVISTACQQNVSWQNQGVTALIMAVNLTARQFYDKQLIPELKKILVASGMQAEFLEVGITEGILMQNTEKTMQIINALKEAGVRVAIDDFGISYASLSALNTYRLDTIKINRSLLDNSNIANNRELANSIMAAGRALSTTVVAQCVETKEQAEDLDQYDCHELQGYYLNKPVTAEETLEFLLAQGN